ncbi:nuclear transport factor 2 family protein [Methanoregula sp.]|uniref:nuclear transport factor 2 family protein n=1 Tax=Methanoregula sp. TaxID=2052170 RepID=UPI00261A7E4D|nr:nuclear transport factor 2 family protein [Methanoregula sp.]MDD5143276.1 nuclear transport factor 2 family protein [Methanoregula sp.]
MDTIKITTDILATIRAMNRAWTTGWHEAEFRQYIHENAVAIVPSEPGRLEGRDAYVAGWRGFALAATIHSWQESDHKVEIFAGGRCSVVTYFFTIDVMLGGVRQILRGQDMFFLAKEGKGWLVAADQYSPEPAVS